MPRAPAREQPAGEVGGAVAHLQDCVALDAAAMLGGQLANNPSPTRLDMPSKSADQVAERFPELRGRVLLMSGFFSEAVDTPHYLQKPFSVKQLSDAIASMLEAPARHAS